MSMPHDEGSAPAPSLVLAPRVATARGTRQPVEPRSIWRVLLRTVVGGLVATTLAYIPVAALRRYVGPADHPGYVLGGLISTQLALLFVAWRGARAESTDVRARLGWVRPNVRISTIALAVLATLFVWALGPLGYAWMHADQWLPKPSEKGVAHLMKVLSESPWPWQLGLLLVGSLGPGMCEEALFRGYLQTRLLDSWRAVAAIAVSGSVFASHHVDPHQILGILPLCYWLGYVAARSGSIVPGMFCHTLVNLCGQSFLAFGVWSEDLTTGSVPWPFFAVGLVGLPAFWLVVRRFERGGA